MYITCLCRSCSIHHHGRLCLWPQYLCGVWGVWAVNLSAFWAPHSRRFAFAANQTRREPFCVIRCCCSRTVTKYTATYSTIYPTRCNVTQFILSGNCSTCFGWYHHPSSGAWTTVSTASGICHTVIANCRYRGGVGTGLSLLWVAYSLCRYSCLRTWLWVMVPPKTCRAVSR